MYYHLAIARDYALKPFLFDPQITEGILAEHSADREFLFHIFLAALVSFGLSASEASFASALVGLLLLSVGLWMASGSSIVVLCGTLGSATAYYRYLMGRPGVLAVGLCIIGVHLLLTRRYKAAAFINIIYTLSYSVPVVLPTAAFLALRPGRVAGPLCVAAGSLIGLLVHPHFPANLVVLYYQGFLIVANALAGNPSRVDLPAELRSPELAQFLMGSLLPLTVFALGFVRKSTGFVVGSLQVIFFICSLKIIRFIEYFVPLSAFSSRASFEWLIPESVPPTIRLSTRAALILYLVVVNGWAVVNAGQQTSVGMYRGAGNWLKHNAPNANIFNAQWDSYPELRYFAKETKLLQGQDPMFVEAYDSERYAAIRSAVTGQMSLAEFQQAFGATHVVARHGTPLLSRLAREKRVRLSYTDRNAAVLELP